MTCAKKHTPAPWAWSNTFDEVSPGAEDCRELVAYGPPDKHGSQTITTLLYLDNFDEPCILGAADACLIAAAPRMYSLIEALAKQGHAEAKSILEEIFRAAIEKAEAKTTSKGTL